jgi:signal peptide peptidase SppA
MNKPIEKLLNFSALEASYFPGWDMHSPKRKIEYAIPDHVGIIKICGYVAYECNESTIFEKLQEFKTQNKTKIVLLTDSPGGSILETLKIVQNIKDFQIENPNIEFLAYIDGYCCSAAYWIASQSEKIYVNEAITMSTVGSIGAIRERFDDSDRIKNDGVKINVFSSGEKKKYGMTSLPMNPEEEAAIIKEITDSSNQFFEAVSTNRNIPVNVIKSWDGGTFTPLEAKDKNLIDEIISFNAFVEILNNSENTTSNLNIDNINVVNPQLSADMSKEEELKKNIEELQAKVKKYEDQLAALQKEKETDKTKLEAALQASNTTISKVLESKKTEAMALKQRFVGKTIAEQPEIFADIQAIQTIDEADIFIGRYQALTADIQKIEAFSAAPKPGDNEASEKEAYLKAIYGGSN